MLVVFNVEVNTVVIGEAVLFVILGAANTTTSRDSSYKIPRRRNFL